MPKEIHVLDILHEEGQLTGLPIGESIDIHISEDIPLDNAHQYIHLVKQARDISTPVPPDYTLFELTDTTEYQTVEVDIGVAPHPSGPGYILSLTPLALLDTSSDYFVYISKDLGPKSNSSSKTNSIGPSDISVSQVLNGSGTDDTYTLTISTQSDLSNGGHTVGYDLSNSAGIIRTNAQADLKDVAVIILSDTFVVDLDPNIPYMLGESWTITTEAFERLGTNKVLEFSTFYDAEPIENAEETSSRLTQGDIISHYENLSWYEAPESSDPTAFTPKYNFVPPNNLYVDFGAELDPTSLLDSTFDLAISYAFGNYLLPQMGMYNEDKKYILNYSLINGDKVIKITINEDAENIVPPESNFIIQAS